MRIVNIILVAFGVIAILGLIFLIVGYALFSFQPDIKSQMRSSSVSADQVTSFNTKIENFKKAVKDASAANQRKIITLTLTEDEINSKVVEMIAEETLPFNELSINFSDNVCWVYCGANIPVGYAKIGMKITPNIVKNDIKVTVEKFQVGKLPLPVSFDNYAADMTNIFLKMQSPINELPLDINNLNISEKKLILEVVSKPAG